MLSSTGGLRPGVGPPGSLEVAEVVDKDFLSPKVLYSVSRNSTSIQLPATGGVGPGVAPPRTFEVAEVVDFLPTKVLHTISTVPRNSRNCQLQIEYGLE